MTYDTHFLDILTQCYDSGNSLTAYIDEETMWTLTNDCSIDIRLMLAKILVNSDTNLTVPILCKLSKDADSCVRVEAIDSLCSFICKDSFDALCNAADDCDELVRAYAAFGIGKVGKHIDPHFARNMLLAMKKNESDNRVLVDVSAGLYILGNTHSLQDLFDLFHDYDYHVKCAVLHVLMEIYNNESQDEINAFLMTVDSSDHVSAVKNTINQMRKVYMLNSN